MWAFLKLDFLMDKRLRLLSEASGKTKNFLATQASVGLSLRGE
jgi:hypothetical protein